MVAAIGRLVAAALIASSACAPSAPLPVSPGVSPPEATEPIAAPAPEAPPARLDAAARGGDNEGLRPGMYAMDVPGFVPAVVVVPPTGSGPRPLLIATHGAGDRAEWHCRIWAEVTEQRGFVLCPQGRRIDERVAHADALYYYPDHHALDRELTAALAALEEAAGPRLDRRRALYAGFSQGAIFGALIMTARAAEFPRGLLVEGGHGHYQEWNRAAARLSRAPDARVFFGCGGPWCAEGARTTSALLEAAGVRARLGYAQGVGHSMSGAMQDELRKGFAWITDDDPRWRR